MIHPNADPNAKSIFVAPSPPKKSLNVLPSPAPNVAPRNPVCSFLGNFFSIDIPNNARGAFFETYIAENYKFIVNFFPFFA